jgi:hypothetical protein
MFQYTDTAIVERSSITSTVSNSTQNDGIYIDDSKNIRINNNTITLNNSYVGPDTPHVDCIQVTYSIVNEVMGPGSSNLLIENNYLENSSIYPVDHKHRQVIYADSIKGYIIIRNNMLVSGIGDNLINNHFDQVTDSCLIYNNTLVGKGNQNHLVNIERKLTSQISVDRFRIKNNIFYKSGTNRDALKFIRISPTDMTNNILNHNLYYLTSGEIPQIRFSTAVNWNSDNTRWENNGIGADPLFTDAVSYKLEYHSPAKNNGLYLSTVTTDFHGNSRPYWNRDYDIGAFEIEDTQLKIGVTGVGGDDEITHSVQVVDTYWERNSSGNWIKSSDGELTTASFSTEGNVTNIDSLKGFQYKWIDRPPYVNSTRIGTGLYKVTNDYNNNSDYIYVDLRDAVQDYSLNVYIQYRANIGYYYLKNGIWNYMENGDVIGIWELPGGSVTTHTGQLDPQFWRYCLVDLEKENHPFLVWAPYTQSGTTNYTLYRKNGASFTSVTPGYTWRHYDSTLYIVQPGGQAGHTVSYYVSAQSSNSDTVNYEITGKNPEKIAGSFSPQFTYSLSQNYPNPFNPTTSIDFSVAEKGLITLKLYDILGREVSTLLSTEMEPGIHKQSFNLGTLASGIYFYRITAGRFIDNKKLQVLK